MKNNLLTTLFLFLLGTGFAHSQKYPYRDSRLSMDKRVANLTSLLSTDEKIDLITKYEVPRLGIVSPGGAEAIHQLKVYGSPNDKKVIQTTSFSQVKGMGETWDPELVQQAGAVMSYEARYLSQNENYKKNTLLLWGPTSDLARDPR